MIVNSKSPSCPCRCSCPEHRPAALPGARPEQRPRMHPLRSPRRVLHPLPAARARNGPRAQKMRVGVHSRRTQTVRCRAYVGEMDSSCTDRSNLRAARADAQERVRCLTLGRISVLFAGHSVGCDEHAERRTACAARVGRRRRGSTARLPQNAQLSQPTRPAGLPTVHSRSRARTARRGAV